MQKINIDNKLLIADTEFYAKKWSFLFHEFSYWLLYHCHQQNLKKLFFFTREGAFFIELVKALQKKFNLYPNIECHLLSVSRIATFLPSVNIDQENPFQRLWNIYPHQSPRAFFRSLDIEDETLSKIYQEKFSGNFDQKISNITNNLIFKQFLNNSIVNSIIKKTIVAKKELLTNYLKQNDFLNDRTIGIVDIGWRGSIQDNLSLIFPEKTIYGFYLGLHRFRGKFISANHLKKAFLFNANMGGIIQPLTSLMRFVLPLEMLCTPALGSVKRYRLDEDHKALPETQHYKPEKIVIEKIIETFQQSVLDNLAFYTLNKKFRYRKCKKIARKIIWNPQMFQLFVYHNHKFDEEFGLGNATQAYPSDITDQTSFSIKSKTTWIKALKESAWISGYLYNKLPKPFLRALPILYLLYSLLTFDNYLLR
ncbi:MAG: hypothetical protein E6K54_03180 [Gammaproteobacteria bacterium]|nr:MAG: hypothetical protein E6K54_03180 [Gammaproteobacteria bacterium]